jgi:hypothetical protein
MEKLQRFFATAVKWPRFLPLIRFRIKLPRNRLFWLTNKLEIIRHYMIGASVPSTYRACHESKSDPHF